MLLPEKLTGLTASQLLGHTALEKFPLIADDGLFQKFCGLWRKTWPWNLNITPGESIRLIGIECRREVRCRVSAQLLRYYRRKEAEDKLQTLAHRLGLATRVLQAGVWDWDLRTENILWDEKMYEIYGLPQNLSITYQIRANAVPPEDLAKVEAIMQNVISSRSQDFWEFRITLAQTRLLTPFGKPVPSGDFPTIEFAASCVKSVRHLALFDCLVRVLADSRISKISRPSPPLVTSTALRSTRKERILISEDNLVNQKVALANLHKLGFNADIVTNGLQVIDALQRKR